MISSRFFSSVKRGILFDFATRIASSEGSSERKSLGALRFRRAKPLDQISGLAPITRHASADSPLQFTVRCSTAAAG